MIRGKKIIKISARIILWLTGIFMLLFATVWLILKVPAVQNYLVTKATSYISTKTHTRVELAYIDLKFPKSILLQGIFLDDKNHDTLTSIKELEIDLNMLALLSSTVSIEHIELTDFYVRLRRNNQDSTFNFQFLADAFSSDPKETTVDTTHSGNAWTIKANTISLIHGRFDMEDAISGLQMNLNAGNMHAQLNKLDLEKSTADLGDIQLTDVHGAIRNTSTAADTDTSSGGWNRINTSGLLIQRSSVMYSDQSSSLLVTAKIGELELENTSIDLAKQLIASDGLSITQSSSLIQLVSSADSSSSANTEPAPDWNIQLSSLEVKQSAFKMDVLNEAKLTKGIDWNHLTLTSINTSTKDLMYNGPLVQATIESLSVQDKSGFGIRSLEAKAYMDATSASLKNLSLITNHSHIGQNISITYKSLSEIMSSLTIDCSMQNNQLSIADVLLLVPDLDTVEIIRKNKTHTVSFNLKAKGNTDLLNVEQFHIKALNSRIVTKGRIKNITDAGNLFADLSFNRIETGVNDLTSILPDSTLPDNLHIPSEIVAAGNYKGTISDFQSSINISSSLGGAIINANINDLTKDIPSYSIALQAHSFDIGSLLNQSVLGKVNGNVDIKGSGIDTSNINASIHSTIESIGIHAYTYQNIHLDGTIKKELIEAKGDVFDNNLNLTFNTTVSLNKQQEYYDLFLNLTGADLQALHLTKEHVTVSANTNMHLTGDPTQYINGHLACRNILVVQNGKRYKEDSLLLVSLNEPGKSNVKLNSSMFAASFEGNIDILSVGDAVTNHFNRYFQFTETKYQQTKPQNFSFEVKLNNSPILTEVILPKLTQYTPMVVTGAFKSEEAQLAVNANITSATYDGTSVKEFVFNLDSDPQKMVYNTGWTYLSTGGINLEQTRADGSIQHDTSTINVTIKDADDKDKIKLNSIISLAHGDHYRFSILKDGLALRDDKWNVADNNYIEIGNKYIFANHFNLSHANQSIKLQSASEGSDMDLQFNNFDLHTLSQIIEDDTLLVQGVLDGEINLKNIHQHPAFTSNLKIKDLAYKNSRVGNINISADNLTADRYTATLELRDSLNRATISGYYIGSSSDLHFNANLQSIELHSLDAFSNDQIRESTGRVKGAIAITGNVKEPKFNGEMQFIDASTKIAYINQRIFMKKETISVSSEKVRFNSFNILDSLNNQAVIDGYVGIKTFDDITFHLNVTTDNFMVLNTTAVNNKLYYGRVFLDSKISIKGNPDLPVINADIDIVKGSHFTFAIPDSKVTVDRGDGIVVFTSDSSSLDPIMLRQTDEIAAEKITGLNLAAKIHIDRNSSLKILVDPISGDSLSVRGDANLNFKMDESGQTSLYGTYTVHDGNYKASLENLIIRKFNISRGSKIIWTGDPLEALIDIKATYTTRTAPDGLLVNTAIIDSSALRKPIPFIVLMSMQGELLKPSISFQLDMPDNYKGAIGGEVYSKITSINANESEVNKQVFALLVLNRFIAPDNSGNSNTASDFARRSVSRMMSNELNKLSSKYINGLQIDVDIQSYNQINSGEQKGNTQVEIGVTKSLFNERLSVEIGGNVPVEGQDAATNSNAKNITGDVTVEYKLTKNGRYKLKAFRKNQYDGITNGNIVETGAGFMYVRNFTHFKELFISKKKRKKLTEQETE